MSIESIIDQKKEYKEIENMNSQISEKKQSVDMRIITNITIVSFAVLNHQGQDIWQGMKLR